MKNIYKVLPVFLAVALLLCGCGENTNTDYDYEDLVEAPLNKAITDCLTEEQVSDVVGADMTLLDVYDEGTQAIYQSADGMVQVTVNLKNESRTAFDERSAALVTVPQEGMGDVAYWSSETDELVVHQNGYTLGVWVMAEGDTFEMSKQIAQAVLEKLPTE